MKKAFSLILILLAAFLLLASSPLFADSLGVDYLCELGINYYERGDYTNALTEFKKALVIDPDNETALDYISYIEEETANPR
mgnify:CR=1 FL=1